MRALYESLSARRRPEDVAETIREVLGDRLSPAEAATLETAARGSLKRVVFGYTSMLEEFARPVGLNRQIARARALFDVAHPLSDDLCAEPGAVEGFVREVGEQIGVSFGATDFRDNRLPSKDRAALGIDLSRRGYNKRFRLVGRMEAKLATLIRELTKRELQIVGKSGLASRLSWEEFSADEDAACFAAYYTARRNLRSEFTIQGQQQAYDNVAEMLLQRCMRNPGANWWVVAHAYPRAHVFSRLSGEQAGQLLGRWFSILQEVAGLLAELWSASTINRATMVVARGNDFTTWNNTAGAWNTARDNWIGLLYALGMEDLLDRTLPGKAMRLIAGDVAAWHQHSGSAPDPNLAVWNELPLPWEVLAGDAECTRATVLAACERHGVDAEKTGWTAPRPQGYAAAFRPTPELVHGVTVANPFLAGFLKRLGYYSGKPKGAATDASM
ncbi:hypothetical protein HKM21_06135 [Longimicrobium terrae]|nr:hypothetical protein [Longimicrobium terrae]